MSKKHKPSDKHRQEAARRRQARRTRKKQKDSVQKAPRREEANPGIVFSHMESPFAGMSEEEHKAVVTEIGENSSKTFDDSLSAIRDSLAQLDPRGVVATLALNTLFVGVGSKGVRRTDFANGFGQAQVELIHAISLRIPESDHGKLPAIPPAVQEVAVTILNAGNSFSFMRMRPSGDDDGPDDLVLLQEYMRQNTQSVRNWGFFRQVTRDLRDLYTPLDLVTEPNLGFRLTDVLSIFEYLVERTQSRASAKFQMLANARRARSKKKMVELFLRAKDSEGSVDEILSAAKERGAHKKKDILYMLKCWDDLTSESVFTFDVAQVASELDLPESRVRSVVRGFGYQYGDLADKDLEHFFLDNPVWQRPIAVLDETNIFSPLPQVFFSFGMRALDSIVSQIDETVLSERRSEFLEDRIYSLVRSALPDARIFRNVKWSSDDVQYETDLVVIVESVVLILEAKSHRISDAALRGAPERLRKHVKETIVHPSEQSIRLASRLEEIKRNPDAEDPLKRTLDLEPQKLGEIVRVSVTLEHFAALQTSMLQLKGAGLLSENFAPCPTMNLTSFESILEILSHPIPLLHYFIVRNEIEAVARIVGDELDYLALYLGTHFDINLASMEGEQRAVITEMSAPIDRYFMSRDEGVELEKPATRASPMFSRILRYIEHRKPDRWVDMGILLSRPSPERQRDFERRLSLLKKRVQRAKGGADIENILIYTPPLGEKYALAFVVVSASTVHRRREFAESAIDQALSSPHVRICTVVVINIDDDAPYCLVLAADGGDNSL